jgi:hypothetical protein
MLADDHWLVVRSGPFEVYTNAGVRPAGRTLAHLEQLRHALGLAFGNPDLATVWPIRVFLLRDAKQCSGYPPGPPELAKEAYYGALVAGAPPTPQWNKVCAAILLNDNTGRLPAAIERGLLDLYSTLEVKGTRVTLGAPPIARTRDWARMQLLSCHPDYSGRLRIALRNLSNGADLDAAFRNAFEKSPAEIDRQVDTYLAAGAFQTLAVSASPIDPDRDFPSKPVDAAHLSRLTAEFKGAFTPHDPPSARDLVDAAQKEKDPAKARTTLEKAAQLNPRWGEPLARLAALETDAEQKLSRLKAAAALDRRTASRWVAVAETAFEFRQYGEAAHAWGAAEQAAADDAERARIHQVRVELTERKAEFEAAEHQRIADEKQRELDRLKQEALNEVHRAEARANRSQPPLPPGQKVEAWWDGPTPSGKARGTLTRVDCVRGTARLVVRQDDGKPIQLLVRKPEQIAISGGGVQTLGCGVQKPARRVVVEYFPKPDPKTGTAGDAATVEFQ